MLRNFDELKNEASTTFGKQTKVNKLLKIFSAMLFVLFFGANFSAYGQNVYVVDRSDDNNVSACDSFANNDCTLRGAIQRANTDGNTSQIQLAIPTSQPIVVAFGSLTIANDQSLLITSDSLVVPSNGRVTIDGGTSLRPFSVNPGANVTFSNILIQKGGFSVANDGAAIDNNGGTVTIDRCLFLNNVSTDDAGAVKNTVGATMTITNTEFQTNSSAARGGAIFNEGTMTISNSLFRGNSAGTDGGAVSNRGTLTVNNSTFSGNGAKRYSGAIDAEAGTINLNSVTIVNNVADSDNNGNGNGGGISVNNAGSPVVNAVNTIIAKNTANSGNAPDFQNTLTSQGFNLIGNTANTVITGTTTGNQLNVDPLILPLANNGGTTFTHALSATSPATDKGRSSGLTTDQRGAGFNRPVDLPNIPNATGGNGADIGAFELQTEPSNITISDVSQNEGNSGTTSFNFTVTLSAAAAQNVTVSYATADGTATAGSDYTAIGATTLTFTPGQTTKTVTILVNGDTTVEPNETFFVNLSNSTNAIISDNQGMGTIVNDDAAPCTYTLSPASPQSVGAAASSLTISVGGSPNCTYSVVSNSSFLTITSATFSQFVVGIAANPGPARSGTLTFEGQAYTINQAAGTVRRTRFDFDGDGKADVSVFRPSQGAWFVSLSTAGFSGTSFGAADDLIAPADYDGDGKTDVAVFRPSTSTWFLLQSTNGFAGVQFGQNGDVPAPADFDGDGKADIAVFRPLSGTWFLLQSTNGFTGTQFGQNGDVPVAGDYDGDGRADVAVFRPSTGTWFIMRSTAGFIGAAFGLSTDKPIPGDFDGDGKFDIAVFRPSDGVFYLLQSTAGFTGAAFGVSTDIPAPADYDGDGKTDIAVFRPSTGTWFLLNSQTGFTAAQFGQNGDKPAPSAFVP